ncbi:hypothetical protein K461DRAFT_268387 [Myriangium duriaei CBS 260.36]|uniref:Uncharacterized protein n=1 Tax=Myriangium duriaei CBS 260.36 TaxID=1168546 RepID=A0A9P4MM66_9PEZI|nr:hypothetical protein K461DRAFT_268387 [Myriangium duriaei CBS 260.36]
MRVASKPSPLVSRKRHKSYRRTPSKNQMQPRSCLDFIEGQLPEVDFLRVVKKPITLDTRRRSSHALMPLGSGQVVRGSQVHNHLQASFHALESHQPNRSQQMDSIELLHASRITQPSTSFRSVPVSNNIISFEPTNDGITAGVTSSLQDVDDVGEHVAARKPWHPPLQVLPQGSPFNSNDWENIIPHQSSSHRNSHSGSAEVSQVTIEVANSPLSPARRFALSNISPNLGISDRCGGGPGALLLSPVKNSFPSSTSNNDRTQKSVSNSTSSDKQRVKFSCEQAPSIHNAYCIRSDPLKTTASRLFVPQTMNPSFSSSRQNLSLPNHNQQAQRTLRVLPALRRPRLLIAETMRYRQ